MSTKPRINPDDIKSTPEDGNYLIMTGLRLGLLHAQESEAKAAENAKRPSEPGVLDLIGAEDYDPKKHGPLPK